MNADARLRLMAKLLPQQVKLREIVRTMGSVEGRVCLDVGLDDPAMSAHLRNRGGTWHTVVRQDRMRPEVEEMVGGPVQVLDGSNMLFEDKTFDLVVVSDLLERIRDDSALITECHRILKPSGRLVVNVPHAKRWSVLHLMEGVLGQSPRKRELAREGYTEPELFQLLKHGFDVHEVRSYSKAFVEAVDMMVQFKASRLEAEPDETALLRFHSRAYSFYWLAFQLDGLLFFTRGYNLVAVAMRHPWRPRKTPILNDGRPISEVVLRKIKD